MRRKLVAGNWKMHGSKASIAALLEGMQQELDSLQCDLIVFPPYIYVEQTAQALANTPIKWGAQNISANECGAYTGEIAATMLSDFACDYVLVGHSERRSLYHEDNVLVAMKFAQAQHNGLIPILCVGETQEQREQGITQKIIAEQLDAVLNLEAGVAQFNNAAIAYEPVWAIGTGMTATSEQAQEVHAFIRQKIAGLDKDIAATLPILYGGSVKANNAAEIFSQADIDGGLIGGASLDANEFLEIARCIN